MSTALSRGEFDNPLLREYFLDQAFDEMFTADGSIRPHYAALLKVLSTLPREELQRRKQSADVSFLMQGITFTVYGREEGTERIFPYDLIPRLVTGEDWEAIERVAATLSARGELTGDEVDALISEFARDLGAGAPLRRFWPRRRAARRALLLRLPFAQCHRGFDTAAPRWARSRQDRGGAGGISQRAACRHHHGPGGEGLHSGRDPGHRHLVRRAEIDGGGRDTISSEPP